MTTRICVAVAEDGLGNCPAFESLIALGHGENSSAVMYTFISAGEAKC